MPQDLGFLGMRTTGTWPVNVQPENYRQMLLLFDPNGMMPLTAFQSFSKSEVTDDPTIHWHTKTMATQRATGTAGSFVYTNPTLATPYVSGGTAGTIVYVKTSLAQNNHFIPGHTVLLRLSTDYRYDTHGRVVQVVKNGANSYAAVKLRQNDPISGGLALVDTILVIGKSNPEGGTAPASVSYDPEAFENKCQIFWTTLSISRRMINTKLRSFDAYQEARREILLYHGLEIEKTLHKGLLFDGTDENGKPLTEMDGYASFITTNASANVSDYKNTTDPNYTGKSWLLGGLDWLEEKIYQLSDFGKAGPNATRLAVCGRGALQAINRLSRYTGMIQVDETTTQIGMKISRVSIGGLELMFKTTAAFSYEPTDINSVMVVDPTLIRTRPMRNSDTRYLADKQFDTGGWTTVDGKQEGWYSDLSFEVHNPLAGGLFYNLGQDNVN